MQNDEGFLRHHLTSQQIHKRRELNFLYKQLRSLYEKLVLYQKNFSMNLLQVKDHKGKTYEILQKFIEQMQQKIFQFSQ